ncbi:amidohydrolase [Pseudoalteromonas fenneropenaei]|uniref:Amidohydrolase n=1 Tax=Pseudoalteromonas fenneropenaei TaxID=1737459 RepID=A0ABV7CD84_9GAMM
MAHQHHCQGCAQCACHNPYWDVFKNNDGVEAFLRQLKATLPRAQNLEHLMPATTAIYTGGCIRPMINGQCDPVEALGIAKGKVVAVGALAAVKQAMIAQGCANYELVTLENGQTLLPGLIEPHVHIVPTAMTMSWLDLSPFHGQNLMSGYSIDYINKILSGSKKPVNNGWILGVGVDPALMPFVDSDGASQLCQIDIATLDAARPDTPVFLISASLHTAYINSKALALIKAANELSDDKVNEIIHQGALQEATQMGWGIKAIPEFQKLEVVTHLESNIREIFTTASQRGVTTMFEAGMQPSMVDMLKAYRTYNPHNVRVGYARVFESAEQVNNDKNGLSAYTPLQEEDLSTVFQAAVKLVSDGSNQGLTGFQLDEYVCNPQDNFGILNFSYGDAPHTDPTKPDFQTTVSAVIDKGWPLLIHANGDQAVNYTINVYETALNGQSGLDKRHRIEHCSLLTDDNAKRMTKLGLSPSFLIGHVGYWGYAFDEVIFKEKAQLLDRCQTMLELGARITLHSDLSVTPLGPLRMMEQAVTRVMEQSPTQAVLNEREVLTKEQALRAITYDAAWQCHIDQWVGSLEPGKLADFVILAKDPVAVESNLIRDIPVLQTWVAGKLRYHS